MRRYTLRTLLAQCAEITPASAALTLLAAGWVFGLWQQSLWAAWCFWLCTLAGCEIVYLYYDAQSKAYKQHLKRLEEEE